MLSPRIIVFGKKGQLAEALAFKGLKAQFVSRETCDLNQPENVKNFLSQVEPDLVINTSAYTDVNRAGDSDQRQICEAINIHSPMEMAVWCADRKIPFVHFSTDYVYKDQSVSPSSEDSPKAPLNFYAESKYLGERAVLEAFPQAWIFRLSWLYSPWGINFVKKILQLGAVKSQLTVVDDQVGTPTSALFLAKEIIAILPTLLAGASMDSQQILNSREARVFNLSGNQYLSWYEFAQQIIELGFELNLIEKKPEVLPISSAESPQPVQRPKNSRMSCQKFEKFFGRSLDRDLKQDLVEVMAQIKTLSERSQEL
jgi:dTDP-4-dehydrorhamnose reductase